jgi:putative phage-type endonuclease
MLALQRTPEWHKERRGKITASVCGTILGVNKNQTPHVLWEQLVGVKPAFKGNYFTWWGTKNEPNALNEYMHQTMADVVEVGFVQHRNYGWLGGSPDGLVGDDGVVEFKCPRAKMYTDDTIPLQYYVQCQVLLEVTDRTWCDLFVWKPDECCVWRFGRDTAFFEAICSTLAIFHAHMSRPEHPPPPTPITTMAMREFTTISMKEHMQCVPDMHTHSPFSKRKITT